MAVSANLRVFDPFGQTLRVEAMRESWSRSRQELADITRRCVQLYEGDQGQELFRLIDELFASPRLQARYKKLKQTCNHVKPLVQEVATIGKRPVLVRWDTGKDQKIWDRIPKSHMGRTPWEKLIPFLSREKALAKNVLVAVGWDPDHEQLEIQAHYPHTCDVGWYPGNEAWDYPDTLTILGASTPKGPQSLAVVDSGYAGQHWDFEEGVIFTIDPAGEISGDAAIPILNGEPLRPFIVMRSDVPRGRSFWVWDGQRELVTAQAYLDYLWTCEKAQIHEGAFTMPLLKGRWTDEQGKLQEILFDRTEILVAPVDPLGKTEASVEWVGPDSKGVLEAIQNSRSGVVWALAESFHLRGEAVVSDNHGAASGYSLRVQKWALNESHDAAARDTTPELEALVRLIRDTWNVTHPGETFTTSGTFSVLIPPFRSGETAEEELRADKLAVDNGFVPRATVVAKWNADLDAEQIETLAEEASRPSIPDVVSLVTSGIATRDEARKMLGLAPDTESETSGPAADITETTDIGDSTNG